MASNRAVKHRTQGRRAFERARKELFEEGISTSRMYLDPSGPASRTSSTRSSPACARRAPTPARQLAEFHERAVVGVQSAAGYDEGLPHRAAPGERW